MTQSISWNFRTSPQIILEHPDYRRRRTIVKSSEDSSQKSYFLQHHAAHLPGSTIQKSKFLHHLDFKLWIRQFWQSTRFANQHGRNWRSRLETLSFLRSENLWSSNCHHFNQRQYFFNNNLQCCHFETPNRAYHWFDPLQSVKKRQAFDQWQLYRPLCSYSINPTTRPNFSQYHQSIPRRGTASTNASIENSLWSNWSLDVITWIQC